MTYNIFFVLLFSVMVPFCVAQPLNMTEEQMAEEQPLAVKGTAAQIESLVIQMQECEELLTAASGDQEKQAALQQQKEAILAQLEVLAGEIDVDSPQPVDDEAVSIDDDSTLGVERVEKQFIAIKTMLFDVAVMSMEQQVMFEKFTIFVTFLLDSSKQALAEGNKQQAGSLITFLEQVITLIKKTFIKLECLTVGKTELGPLYGMVSKPLVYSQVQRIALSVTVALVEYFESYVWGIQHEGFVFNDVALHQLLVATIMACLPTTMKSVWWEHLLCCVRKSKEGKLIKQLIAFDLYQSDPEVCEQYLIFVYGMRKVAQSEEQGKIEGEVTSWLQRNLVANIHQAHREKSQQPMRLVALETFLYKVIKNSNVKEVFAKLTLVPMGSIKQEIFLRHKLLTDDVLLSATICHNHEFAEYYRRYCRIVEGYLSSDIASFDMKYDLYALVKHLKLMLVKEGGSPNKSGPVAIVGHTWLELAWLLAKAKALKDFIWPNANITGLFVQDMLEILEFIAKNVGNHHGHASEIVGSQGVVSSILQGNFDGQGNGYADKMKHFLQLVMQGNIEGAKQEALHILGKATPAVGMVFLKMLMPVITGPVKSMAKQLLTSWLDDDNRGDKKPDNAQKQKLAAEEGLARVIALLKDNPEVINLGRLAQMVSATQA